MDKVAEILSNLSEEQKQIAQFDKGLCVVRACPGSGKTYSVASRIALLFAKNHFSKKGIAALSFTNVAVDEIREKLSDNFSLNGISHPHFIGTLDSFINQFIFLPFGHLIMECPNRPELVGEPHSTWSIKKYPQDYAQYFDKTTFDINDKLIQRAPAQSFHFLWKYYNISGAINGNIQNIINSKLEFFKKGYATQADANYLSLKILMKYPKIAESIAKKFEYFIIDEAQDTDEILMAIIDIFNSKGAENIMLIGDRDQAIFEWNNAKPHLFDEKYVAWNKIELIENRRSSQLICDFTKYLSSFNSTVAITPGILDFRFKPLVNGYLKEKKASQKDPSVVTIEESIASFNSVLETFLKQCTENGIEISQKNVAVLYRGKAKVNFLGLTPVHYENSMDCWEPRNLFVKTIIRGKLLYDSGLFVKGYKLMERGLIEYKRQNDTNSLIVNNEYVQTIISEKGFMTYRKGIHHVMDKLPTTKDKTISAWIKEANRNLRKPFVIKTGTGQDLISEYFGETDTNVQPFEFYHGTIHSVKGRSFDAVLILLSKKSGFNYATMLKKDKSALSEKEQEELRIIYVGMTRPRKILQLAVPTDDVDHWTSKFNV
ncbi:ATP-dependent helicase [Chryseobacterium sp. OSA05B]|uniref:ATP-dependent helicase n=1 Tax=Chryseobacterium sp. OSA05B TaxID=2862650 RepID=UPI001CBF44C0|nr:ATP-dependent helicase [Chryseobacterium sp. OSA05B]